MNPLAEALNKTIATECPVLMNLLSERGRALFFPTKGIMAQAADAKGKKWNATIGIAIDDDGTPMRLPVISEQISLDPKAVFPYASSYGNQQLREYWQQMIYQKNPSFTGTVSLPVVTNALTHSLSIAGMMFVDPGATIITSDLYWGNYNLMFKVMHGINIDTFNTFKDGAFDTEALQSKLSEGTGKKVLLLNCPNNPAGYMPTVAEAEKITEIVLERAQAGDELLVIIDDAYFGQVYEEGVYRESLFAKLGDLHENVICVKVDGPTKEDFVWGFRVGFMSLAGKAMTPAVHQAIESKIGGAVRGTVSNVCHHSQSVLLAAYQAPTYEAEKAAKLQTLAERYRAVKQELKNSRYNEFFTALPYNSGYFMCIEINDGLDAEAVRQKLLQEYDTGLISMGSKLRISFSCVPVAEVPALFENIYLACQAVNQEM